MSRTAYATTGLLLITLVLLLPVLIAPLPPIGDYPNHLARMWLLSSADGRASMAQFYQIRFDTYTNVAIDLIALTVGKFAGYQFAGRLSIALAVVLPPLGGALLWLSIFRRASLWMLSFGLLAWGGATINGFLNFKIAVGLALIFAALDPAVVRRGAIVQIVGRALLSLVLLLAHPFGLVFYALLIFALAIGPRLTLSDWRPSVTRLALLGVSVFAVAALFIMFVPSLPGAQEHTSFATLREDLVEGAVLFAKDPKHKLSDLFLSFRSYSNYVDGATLLAFLLPVAIAALGRQLRVHAGLMLLSAMLVLAYLACPDHLLGAAWVDSRFAVMLPLAFAASVAPMLTGGRAALSASVLVLFFIGRTAYVADLWQARQADVASVAEAIASIPNGATVIPFEQRPLDRKAGPRGRFTSAGETSFRHLAALVVTRQHAFVPTLFAARGKQPVITMPPWDEISEPNGGTLNEAHVLDVDPPPDADQKAARYFTEWRKFDYMLLLNADMTGFYGPFVPPPALTLVRDAGFAKLYRIAH